MIDRNWQPVWTANQLHGSWGDATPFHLTEGGWCALCHQQVDGEPTWDDSQTTEVEGVVYTKIVAHHLERRSDDT